VGRRARTPPIRFASKLAADPSLEVTTPERGLHKPQPTAPHSLAFPYSPSCNAGELLVVS